MWVISVIIYEKAVTTSGDINRLFCVRKDKQASCSGQEIHFKSSAVPWAASLPGQKNLWKTCEKQIQNITKTTFTNMNTINYEDRLQLWDLLHLQGPRGNSSEISKKPLQRQKKCTPALCALAQGRKQRLKFEHWDVRHPEDQVFFETLTKNGNRLFTEVQE